MLKKVLCIVVSASLFFSLSSCAKGERAKKEKAAAGPILVKITEVNHDTFKEKIQYYELREFAKYRPAFHAEDKKVSISPDFSQALKEKQSLEEFDVNVQDLDDVSKAGIFLIYTIIYDGEGRYNTSVENYISGKDALTIKLPAEPLKDEMTFDPYTGSIIAAERIRLLEKTITVQRKEDGTVDVLCGPVNKNIKAGEEALVSEIKKPVHVIERVLKPIPINARPEDVKIEYSTVDYGVVDFSTKVSVENYGQIE